jgi:predicted membrane protein
MSRDLKKYASQTNVRLIVGGLLLLFVVGIGLIYLFYGQGAALTGLLCMVVALIPLILIWVMFIVLEFITKKAQDQ